MRAVSLRSARATIALAGLLAAAVLLPTFKASNAAADPPSCFSGAHSLSTFGARLYPEMGNGGYTSLHTDLRLNYDAIANLFLPGTQRRPPGQVDPVPERPELRLRADERAHRGRHGAEHDRQLGPGQRRSPRRFTFVQPTYPGDPNGQDDPDPAAHAVSNANPVSATNPNPPACSPQVSNTSQNGTQCPANKLVVTPSTPIPDGTTVHGDDRLHGPPRRAHRRRRLDRGLVPHRDRRQRGRLRHHRARRQRLVDADEQLPDARSRPTTSTTRRTSARSPSAPASWSATRRRVGTAYQPVPAPPSNPPDANFPRGSVTWHWHSPERIANYLVENSIGAYDLVGADEPDERRPVLGGAGAARSRPRKRRPTRSAMDNQEDIVNFQTSFNGPWPVTTDGDRRRHAVGELRGGDAGQDHLRGGNRRLDRPVARHVQPREHAPVVRRQRRRGRVQPHVLEGGLRHARRVPHTARTAAIAAGGWHAGRRRGVRDEPDQPVQRHELQLDQHDVLDAGAVEPDRQQPVHDGEHLHAARHCLRRAVADARHARG